MRHTTSDQGVRDVTDPGRPQRFVFGDGDTLWELIASRHDLEDWRREWMA